MPNYSVRFPCPADHLIHVAIECPTRGASTLEVAFPAWSPGRYFIYDFARNVQELSAIDAAGKYREARKVAKGRWQIESAGAERIVISYKVYADTLSGTFSQLDDRHASINGPSVFAWIVGQETEPVALTIDTPDGWKVYTSLPRRRRGGRSEWNAPNYDVLIDSPFEIGNPVVRRFNHQDISYHLVLDFAAGDSAPRSTTVRKRIDRFVSDVEKIVHEYTATFGRPEFDAYYFLVNIDPFAAGGDGMEHLSSTRLVLNGYITDDENYADLIGVASHEFFHIWNVKRMRPAELGPFDYSFELHTDLLWLAEGFTQYYGHLMLRRAGVWDDRQFRRKLVAEINLVELSPGRFHRNLRESSFDTWLSVSRRNTAVAANNLQNTYVNYYHKGAVAALLIDMEIRRLTNDRRSLDDLMRDLYRTTYAQKDVEDYYLRGNGYSEGDVLAACERVAGRTARRSLKKLIESRGEVDYRGGLSHVGLRLVRGPRQTDDRKEGAPVYLGVVIVNGNGNGNGVADFVTVDNIIPDSPAQTAGMSPNDIVVAVDGERVTPKRWDKVMSMKRPGDRITMHFFRGARLMTADIVATGLDARPFRIEPVDKPSPAQKRGLKKWCARVK